MTRSATAASSQTVRQLGQHRYLAGVVVVWFGLLAPLAVSESRPASEIAANPITLITLFRGVAPVLCLLAAVALLRPRLWPQHLGEWLAVAFASVALASTVWSLAPMTTLLKAGVLAAVYGLVIVLVRTWRTLEQAVGAVVTVAQFLVISSIVGAVLAPQSVFTAYYRWGGHPRLRGLFPEVHPVPLGWLALVGLMGVLAGLGYWEWQRRPAARTLLGAASFTALLLTQTRAAWAGAAVVALAYVMLRVSWRHALKFGGLIAVGAVAAVVVFPSGSDAMMSLLARGQNEQQLASLGGRLPMWERAVDVWSSEPLTGYGYYVGHRYGPYAEWFAKFRNQDEAVAENAYIDGAYVETMLDLGLLGLIPLSSLAVSAFGRGLHRLRVGKRDTVVVVAVLMLAGLLVDSVLSYSWQTPSYQGELLLALALALHTVDDASAKNTAGYQLGDAARSSATG